MKKQRIFPGIILLGFGTFFLLQEYQVAFWKDYATWPTLLIIVGIAFLFQGYMAKDYEAILPGVILFGFGFHFHIVGVLEIWPDSIGIFILIIALGFLLRSQKVGAGFLQGILFLVLAILLLFSDKVTGWFGFIEGGITELWKFWPVLLIVFGIYLLFIKKK